MRSKIKAPAAMYPRILDRMFFPEMKVREGVKKVISCGKIQSRVFQGLYLIMKFH